MDRPLRILHLEDNRRDAELVWSLLEEDGFTVEAVRVETREEYMAKLENGGFNLIFSNDTLPSFEGASALALAKEKSPGVPYLFVSSTIDEDVAIEAITHGATDYVLKHRLSRLVPAIRRALRETEEQARRQKAEDQIRQMAYEDPLTGLPNRAWLQERLEEALRVGLKDQSPLALLLMDLDRFKDVNNTLGHVNGDRLLQEVGRRLQDALQSTAQVAHLFGDEFSILVLGDAAQAVQTARAALETLYRPFVLEGLSLDVRASLGIALAPDHGWEARLLFQRADVAMYEAKARGGGHAVYAPQRDPYKPARLALMGELRHAITAGQLLLHYQPKVNLKTRRVSGVEALTRWKHPHRGLIPPMEFIPLAEYAGLIKPMTTWAIRQALCQIRVWQQAGLHLPGAVNLSAPALLDPELPKEIARSLEATGVEPECLGLELTESVIMAEPDRALEQITSLNRMGVKLSVDDFGTGYSSLAYLKRLPVQELKIDKTFVQGLMRDRNDATIVRAAIDLGHALGLSIVAEGVEDQQTWHGLQALSCDEAQGYFIGHPLPPDDLTRWLQESAYGGKPGLDFTVPPTP